MKVEAEKPDGFLPLIGGLLGGIGAGGAAAIGAGATLIGGALNRKAQKDANKANSPTGQVAQWEAAGINPLFGISSGGYIPQRAVSMGDAFANAGNTFARGLELDHEQDLRETNLELQNEKLRKQLDKLAKPIEPSHMDRHGGILPLPSNGGFNASGQSSVQDVRVAGVRADGRQADATRRLNVTTPYGEMTSDPNWTPASEIEDEYGEAAGLLYSSVRAADFLADQFAGPVARTGKSFADWMTSIGDDHGVAGPTVSKKRWGNSPPRSIAPTAQEIDKYRYLRNVSGGF